MYPHPNPSPGDHLKVLVAMRNGATHPSAAMASRIVCEFLQQASVARFYCSIEQAGSCRKFRTGIRGDGGRGNAGSNTIDYVIITTAMRQQPYLLLAPGTADRVTQPKRAFRSISPVVNSSELDLLLSLSESCFVENDYQIAERHRRRWGRVQSGRWRLTEGKPWRAVWLVAYKHLNDFVWLFVQSVEPSRKFWSGTR